MKSFTPAFSRTLLMLMSLLALSLCSYQSAQAAPLACTYIIEGGTSKLIVDGKQTEFAITVRASQPSCTWTAKSNNPTWIHITNGGSYTGSAQVTVLVDHNTTQVERTGTINMVGEIYTIKQEDNCFYVLTDMIQTVGKAGGDITVKAASNCPATVIPEVSWIKFNGPANHPPFTKAITFTVAPNNGPARTGRVKIAKYYLTVHQEGTCQYTLLSTSQSVLGVGGNYFVEVTRHRTCQVTAISDSAWVKITNTTGGSEEKARIDYSVSPNSGAARTAKLAIAGQPVTISQAAAQSAPILFALNPGFVVAGMPSTTVMLLGNNFTANSQARWNGSNRPTTLINASQLKSPCRMLI
jgi:Putative binding domain, N-terminal